MYAEECGDEEAWSTTLTDALDIARFDGGMARGL